MKPLHVLTVLALTVAPVSAFAAAPEADACAGSLSAHGKMIYDAAKPRIKPGVKIADEIRSAARPLVMGGKLSKSEAQPAAEAAGKCLAMING
jgi:hypothetical protein